MPRCVRLMALTATATLSTRKFIIKNLNMQDTAIVYVPPLKNNTIYFVTDKPRGGISEAFQPIVDRLMCELTMDRIIIFCRLYDEVIGTHNFFQRALGEYFTQPTTTLNIEWWTSILTAHTPLGLDKIYFFSTYFALLLCSINLPILLFRFTHFAPSFTHFAFQKFLFSIL